MPRCVTVLLIALVCGPTVRAMAEPEVTLVVHHFLGPQSVTQTALLEPWAERLDELSGGRIAVRIFPAMALGGAPPDLYRQVRDGTADVVWTLPGYTPGVFPRVEVFELPTVHGGSAEATTLAIQDVLPLIEEDFRAIKPLLVSVHGGNALILTDQTVRSPADVRGLKLRTPSRTGAWMIEAWQAEPVAMPLPDVPQAFAAGLLDGALVPFEIVPPFRLQELIGAAVEGADGTRFGTSVFLFAMNRARYDSLPPDLRAAIDASVGPAFARSMGQAWDRVEPAMAKVMREAGVAMIGLDDQTMAAFAAISAAAVDRWIAQAEAHGFDGAALVAAARTAVAAHTRR